MQPFRPIARDPHASDAPGGSIADHQGLPREPVVSALVVSGLLSNAMATAAILADWDFHVTVAETFEDAKARVAQSPPALLLTDLRLREFNGLQLVLHGKARRPAMGAIVFASVPDPVLQADAEALGATFVVKPVDSSELIAAAVRTLLRPAEGPEALEPIRPPYERRTHERRVQQVPTDVDRRRAERRRDRAALLAEAARLV